MENVLAIQKIIIRIFYFLAKFLVATFSAMTKSHIGGNENKAK